MSGAAVITGAARRIGRVLAVQAARSGHDVAVHHRDSADEAEETADLVRAEGRRACILASDLAAPDAGDLIGRAEAVLGPVTLLVNNASLFIDDRLLSFDVDTFDAHMATNLRAPALLAQAMAARLPDSATGVVINILDQRVWRPNPQFFGYSLSKAALWHATQTMAQALAPRIRVNAIGPGPTLGSVHQAPGEFEREAAGTPLGHSVNPDEIAGAMRYLIDAPSVTGQMIAVDSGQHLGWLTPDIIHP